jgi:predicted ATPase/class 3 adenylate cyclase/Tfp pilus assembly protein PilF
VTDQPGRLPTPQIANDLAATWRSYLPEHVMRLLMTVDGVGNPPVTQRLDAVVLFADVVGFTTMAESLSASGSYGTEQLTRVINRWFAVTADAISGAGGSVVDFAGDALVGMFDYTPETYPAVASRAVRCAELIREVTASVAPVSTPDGPRSLTIRVGLAGGPLLVMVVGDPAIRLQHLIAGPALDYAIEALHRAGQGEIVVQRAVRDSAARATSDCHTRPASPPPADDLEPLLAPFVHPAIRARLRSGRHELVNEHRKVTIAFVCLPDLSIEDPRTVQALQRYLAAGVAVIDRYGGHLRHLMADDKGTVLVALFGTPVSHEDDEERAVRCCLELLALPGVSHRGGVTTGQVYCGEVGSDVRREYAVVGDAVILAARLMQAAPAARLLIDQATYERARDIVVAEGPVRVAAKGKPGPVTAWAVREAHDASQAAPLPSSTAGPLVGRVRELLRLRTLAQQVRAGSGLVVWLHGEAGIGKSRLAAEVCLATRTFGFGEYAGSCRPHGTSATYLVWRSMWQELLEIDPMSPIPVQRAALTARIARYDGSGQLAPVLAAVVNLPMPDTERTAQLDPAGRDQLLRSTLLACLRDRAAAGPLVLLLEDCHWIDPASLALLGLLARHLANLPVLVLATSREPVPDSLAALDHVVDVPLTEITGADANRLVRLRLRDRYGQDADVHPRLVRAIAQQAGGNAFFIAELVSYLHSRGVKPDEPQALADLHVPDSLQRLVMARIDQLTDDEKATIKVASVIGRRFRPRWITSVYPAAGTAEQVQVHLSRLDALDLIPQVAAEPEPEYEFKHPVTLEAAYQSITYDTRDALHERIGRLVEETFPDRLSQYVDVLAHHYGRTGRTDKQRVWFQAAGDRAKAMFANETAIDYYRRLLPLLTEAERAELHVEIGTVYYHTGKWTEAENHYRLAMSGAEATGRRDILAAGQRQLGDLLMYTRSYAESIRWLKHAYAGFEGLGDAAGLSRTMDRMTFALFRQGTYGEALAMAQRHLAMATEVGDLSAMSTALNHIGLVHLNTGRLQEALDHLRRSLTTAQRAGDRHRTLNAACNLGWAWLRGADHLQAIAHYRHALAVAQDIGARHTANVIIGNMGEIYREEGEFGRARTCALHSLRLAVDLGAWSSVADQLANLGAIAAAEGSPTDAQHLLERAVGLARELDAPYYLCDWLHRLARLHLAAGRAAMASQLNMEALRIANEHAERDTQVNAYVLWVRLRVAAGQVDAETASQLLRKAASAWNQPHERAALLDAAYQVDQRDDNARTTAAEIYRRLYERAPSVEYRHAYRRLTGVDLPPGPPLPPLPSWISTEDGSNLETLLRRIDRSPRHQGPG